MKLETAAGLHLDHVVFLGIKSFCFNVKLKESKTKRFSEIDSLRCKQKCVQDNNKYSLEEYIYCLQRNKIKFCV